MNGLWVVSVVVHAYVALRLLPGVVAAAGAAVGVAAGRAAGRVGRRWCRSRCAAARASARREEVRRSDMLAWASLTLMGLFSSLFVLTLLRDVVELVLLAGRPGRAPKVPGHAGST